MYATTGRNAPSKTTKFIDDSNIEITGTKWYNRVPSRNHGMQNYVLGDDDDEDELAPRWFWFGVLIADVNLLLLSYYYCIGPAKPDHSPALNRFL